MKRDESAPDVVEVRANAFAARFLIPPDLLAGIGADAWVDPNRISEIVAQLGASVSALLYSLSDAKLIGRNQIKAMKARAPRVPEAPDLELEGDTTPIQRRRREALMERGLSAHYVGLCFEAYGRGLITLGLLSEMLLTTPSGAHDVAALFGRTIGYG